MPAFARYLGPIVLAVSFGAAAQGQTAHDHGTMTHEAGTAMGQDHAAMTGTMAPSVSGPTEPGQGAFAAIAEIVAMLRADPATVWSQVDISALRDHLVDMDRLVTDAEVAQTDIPGGAEFRVALTGAGGAAASRMVPAHAPVLTAETGWTSDVQQTGDVLVWRVTSGAEADVIRALGFFGLMAVGDHHRAHHLAIAKGRLMH